MNRVGINAVDTAKRIARIYDKELNTNRHSQTLLGNLKTIRDFKQNDNIDIIYENPHSYDDEGASHSRTHKAVYNNKIIYEDLGDEYEFFRNFANAIEKKRLSPRDLNPREIDDIKKQNFIRSRKTTFINDTFEAGNS